MAASCSAKTNERWMDKYDYFDLADETVAAIDVTAT
jgi:hypothetical protein